MFSVLLMFGFFLPHGDLSIRIAEKTEAIKNEPTNWLLYMKRGELFYQHEQPDSALIDYKFAITNGLDTPAVFLLKAEAELALGKLSDGLNSVEQFLEQTPSHLKGIHVRALLYRAQHRFDRSISDFEQLLEKAESPKPQTFVELSNLYLSRDSTDFANAINILNRGRKKLGNIISLEMKLYLLEKQRSNFEAAHTVLDRIIRSLSRKERLMVEKAELFLLENKGSEAAEFLVAAENAVASLPPRFQNVGATKKLIQQIEELKKQL